MLDLAIRPARETDAVAIQRIYAVYVETTVISFETAVPSVDEMRQRISKLLASHHPYVVAERDGSVQGYAYASPHRVRAAYQSSVDVTVYVDRDHHGHGIGTALYQSLFKVLSDTHWHAAFAGITLPNAASVGLHERMGFTKVGVYHEVGQKFGRFHDVGWWQRLI
ncbi:MAG: arsinothricin resistance N-acetyltransferase ArsN1 family B [Pseudomonadota bacterium]